MVEPYPNVIYLQNTCFPIPETDIVVYGGTFWSQLCPQEVPQILSSLNDYRCIPALTVTETSRLHHNAVQKLEQTLNQEDYIGKKFVVVSHHLPSYSLISQKYRYCGINSAFATDLELANDPRIVAWFCGHTHEPCELGKFHVNPVGYPEESRRRPPVYDKVIDIPV